MIATYDISVLLAFVLGVGSIVIPILARLVFLADRRLRIEVATAEALRQREERFRSLVQNSSDMIAILDARGILEYVSPSSERILGYKPEELVGKNYFKYIHSEDIHQVRSAFISNIKNAVNTVAIEYRIQNKEGNWIYLESISKNLLNDPNIRGFVVNSRNITKRKQAEETVRQIEQKYRDIVENAVEGIFQTTIDGKYLTVNPMLAVIYGYDSPAELMATITDIKHQLYVDPQRRLEFKRILQEKDAIWGFESQVYRKDGQIIWISESARAVRDADGNLLGYEGTVVDITQRKQAEAELQKRDKLLEGVAAAMTHLLTSTDYSAAIDRALQTLGKATGIDRIYIQEQHPDLETNQTAVSQQFEWTRFFLSPNREGENLANSNQNKEQFTCSKLPHSPCPHCPISEQKPPLSQLIVPIFVDDRSWGYICFEDYCQERQWSSGEESILMAMAASIGGTLKRQRAEDTIRYQAFHDLLTGLPNRNSLNERLSTVLTMANKRLDKMAVMFLDLDRFKTINDTLGHAVGDRLLQQATQRLKGCVRSGDLIARWGGDEFTLLLPQINTIDDATKIAQRILDVLKPAFDLEGYQLYITSSIGIAIYPEHGEDAKTLLKNADAALYRAKAEGRNNYQIYTPAMNSQASELLELDNSLHKALEQEQFVIYYQPQVDSKTGNIISMEALLRWKHPRHGQVLPQTFISLAEENGLIVPLGNWVLRTACYQNKAWQDAGLPPVRVAVNISLRQLQQASFVDTIAEILAETGLKPEFLELEITETAVMQNAAFTREVLKRLVNMGCQIALDDFGTGYSSLNYLKTFPLHTLKIHQSFIQDLTVSSADSAIVNTIIALGRGLNLSVVAEGVETFTQMEYLQSLQCEKMQGYLFSHPLPASEAKNLLAVNSQLSLVISH